MRCLVGVSDGVWWVCLMGCGGCLMGCVVGVSAEVCLMGCVVRVSDGVCGVCPIGHVQWVCLMGCVPKGHVSGVGQYKPSPPPFSALSL